MKANEINDSYLVNKYKEGDEHYKVLSSQKRPRDFKDQIGVKLMRIPCLFMHINIFMTESGKVMITSHTGIL
ncbi:hypothetical protein MASR2M39_19600 [Ignavibacteriales bacterium]